ncbi:hypothetical protein Dimus_012144 [Dionaea muscipula]
MNRKRDINLITIFVEDLPDSMNPGEFYKLFAKFGVVKDAFIPRKRNKMGRRFGFILYNCLVAADIWIRDKELKVKRAVYDRRHEWRGPHLDCRHCLISLR